MNHYKLNDWDTYKTAFHLSNYVWAIVIDWNRLAKCTVGEQFIRSIDSISANMAEGWGRHNKRDKVRFFDTPKVLAKNLLIGTKKPKYGSCLLPSSFLIFLRSLTKFPKA